jgi:hypothetical protein
MTCHSCGVKRWKRPCREHLVPYPSVSIRPLFSAPAVQETEEDAAEEAGRGGDGGGGGGEGCSDMSQEGGVTPEDLVFGQGCQAPDEGWGFVAAPQEPSAFVGMGRGVTVWVGGGEEGAEIPEGSSPSSEEASDDFDSLLCDHNRQETLSPDPETHLNPALYTLNAST